MINEIDRKILENKFHKTDEPFDPYRRMEYHGYDYDESTGLNDAEIDAGLKKLSDELEGQPHPVVKAKLFEYVLDNTRIDVNEHDYFVGIYTWGRPISKYVAYKWMDDVREAFPEASAVLSELDSAGIAFGWLDFDHTVPDWEALMSLGFPGLLKRAEDAYEKLCEKGEATEKQTAFFEGVRITYAAIIRLIDRMYRYALTKNGEKSPKTAQCLKNLRDGAPETSYDAMQMIYLYFMLSESVDHYQVRSLGYGLDNTLYPFWKNDMENGTFSDEEFEDFVSYFLMQWSAIGNYWGQPVYFGGTNPDGTTKINELSYKILDIYDRLGIFNPKVQIKVGKSTPKDFIMRILEMIRGGNSSFVFVNEEVITKCLMARGATYEQALDSVISGCYEYKVKAKGIGISGSYFNALKPVSLVLNNGFDKITNKQVSIKTGNPEDFESFEEFYKAYLSQLEYVSKKWLDAMNRLEEKVGEINPSHMFSGTIEDCVNTMTDALDSGIENTSDCLLCGVGTAVDALMAVRELVFDKKICTMAELKAALDANWEGYEKLRARAKTLKCKYGNGIPAVDGYANAIISAVADMLHGRKNSHGGRHILEIHSARAFIKHGEKTEATPDGRLRGDEMSKNASPSPGADRSGITALINSATSIDPSLARTGFCLDAMLHPSAVSGDDGLEAFYSVLMTYMEKQGASIHFNIFDTETLRDAQLYPEKYENLQVRICGWNALWNSIGKAEQDAYIERCEAVI